MEESNRLIRVYSGMESSVNLLKDELGKIGITCIVQNEFSSGITAGFSAMTPSAVDLFIQEIDLKKAQPVIRGFIQLSTG